MTAILLNRDHEMSARTIIRDKIVKSQFDFIRFDSILIGFHRGMAAVTAPGGVHSTVAGSELQDSA